jgi:hypothetical protein
MTFNRIAFFRMTIVKRIDCYSTLTISICSFGHPFEGQVTFKRVAFGRMTFGRMAFGRMTFGRMTFVY